MMNYNKSLRRSLDTPIIVLILTFAFTRGIFGIAGIPTIIPKSIMEFLIVMLFAKALYLRHKSGGKKVRIIGCLPMAFLFCICVLSYVLIEQPWLKFLFFMRNIFVYYLLFVALLHLNLSENDVKAVNKFLVFLFLIQLPAGTAKYVYYGLYEGGIIGTICMHGGNYSTTLPLFAMAFLFSFYLFRRKNIYLVLIFAFFLFGLGGRKRALAFYIPLLLFFLLYLYTAAGFIDNARRIRWMPVARKLTLVIIVSCVGIYVAGRALYSLNPDARTGGSFDPAFMINTAIDYLTMETEEGYTFGRINTTSESLKALRNAGPLTMLLGFGPGLLTESSLTGTKMVDVTVMRFGISRGQTGLVWLVLQIGIPGVILLLTLYFQLFRTTLLIFRETADSYWKAILLGFLGATFVFVLDFLTYSQSTMFWGVLTPAYFYIAAICFKRYTFQADSQSCAVGIRAQEYVDGVLGRRRLGRSQF